MKEVKEDRIIKLQGPPENWPAEAAAQERQWHTQDKSRARNWGIVCGFGYGYAAALLTFMILISLN